MELPRSQLRKLADLFDIGDDDSLSFEAGDLKGMLQFELQSPLAFDLSRIGPEKRNKIKALASSTGLLLSSIGGLLRHPQPPLSLLILMKEYAKEHSVDPDSRMHSDVAHVLYYASIVKARLNCDQSISALEDHQVIQGLDWALRQTWIDDDLRTMFEQGRKCFTVCPPSLGQA